MISRDNATPFSWGDDCEGWRLIDGDELCVVQERMPPGRSEKRHLHRRVRQLYFVLAGTATVEIEDDSETIEAGEALPIPPGTPHRIRNLAAVPLEFLVISSGPPAADRHELPQ